MYYYEPVYDGQNNIVGYDVHSHTPIMILQPLPLPPIMTTHMGTYYPSEYWYEGGKDDYYGILPPPASDRAAWERYKNLYPGFAVDVFHSGKYVGTFSVSDGNSPVHYDHVLGEFWKLSYDAGGYGGLGDKPKLLEGSPQCRDNKVLIPFDGGITTCLRTGDEVAKERRVFA